MGAASDWRDELRRTLPAFGHRNWILVADSAFPLVTGGGLRVVVTGEDQHLVLEEVIRAVGQAPHVAPHVYVDAELAHLDDELAPGVSLFRDRVRAFCPDAVPVLHEELIGRVNAAAESFAVLLLKTTSILPYTTVFLELDCGYWDATREARLREKMSRS